MSKKEIQLLQQQIDRLDTKDFDLGAWKKYSILILGRLFGEDNEKIRQIKKLEFEFNSWALRDASGNESYEEGTKKLAREIIQAAIDEIKVFGLPEIKEELPDKAVEEFISILLDELKGSQVKKLKTILKSKESKDEKRRMIKEIMDEIGEYGTYEILTSMVMAPAAVKVIRNS